MPPRVQLTSDEAERLPELLAQVDSLRSEFPNDESASVQAGWIRDRYFADAEPSTLSLNLVTLLLFEHGVHRSVDQVTQDLAILSTETNHTSSIDPNGGRT